MKSLILSILLALAIVGLYFSHSQWECEAPMAAPPTIMTLVDEPPGDRVSVDGLPVPIYPGTLVTSADVRPPDASFARVRRADGDVRFVRLEPTTTRPIESGSQARTSPIVNVTGQLSATELRAKNDARLQLERQLSSWLSPDIPMSWKAPVWLVDRVVLASHTKPVVRDYGTLYETTVDAEFSHVRRGEFLEAYQRDVVGHRLTLLGGLFGFVLACLAALAGYIRADEATKGYYTNWLRAGAAAGVGAAGVLIYQLLS